MEVRQILEEVFELTNMPIRDLEHEFGPDTTGLTTLYKQNYENDRVRDQTGKGYEKVLFMVGLIYKIIASFKFASRSTDHESLYFEVLLRETACRYGRLGLVGGDAAYLSCVNCDLVAVLGATPRFYPQKGSTLRQKGSVAWRRLFEDVMSDPQKWLEDYHKCSNVEGCFSTFKRNNPLSLRKQLDERK